MDVAIRSYNPQEPPQSARCDARGFTASGFPGEAGGGVAGAGDESVAVLRLSKPWGEALIPNHVRKGLQSLPYSHGKFLSSC